MSSSNSKCDIIICVWNNLEVTRDCIESIYKNTRFPYTLILIDNASEDPTREYLLNVKADQRFEVTLIRNEENVGNTRAVNQGIKASTSEFICNLDNDTYVTEGWLTEMVDVAKTDTQIGIVGSAGRGGNPPRSAAFEDIEAKAKEVAKRRGAIMEMALIDCYCALFRKSLIEDIGSWDEVYSPGYFDDSDFCRRATQHGYRIVAALGAYVYHREGTSFRKRNTAKEELFNRNKAIYTKRYGEPRRLLYIIDKCGVPEWARVQKDVYQKASQAHWVTVIGPRGVMPKQVSRHSHIKEYTYSPIGFASAVLWRVLTKRKKRFNSIYVFDQKIKFFLDFFRFFHRSEVVLL